MELEDIPVEILHHIFSYFSGKDLASVCCVSKTLNLIADDPHLWKTLYLKINSVPPPEVTHDWSWKQLYLNQTRKADLLSKSTFWMGEEENVAHVVQRGGLLAHLTTKGGVLFNSGYLSILSDFGKNLREFSLKIEAKNYSFFMDFNSEFLAFGYQFNKLEVWNWPRYQRLFYFDNRSSVQSLKFDQSLLAIGGRGGLIKILNLNTLKEKRLNAHISVIHELHFESDFLISGSHDGTLKVWNKWTYQLQNSLDVGIILKFAYNKSLIAFTLGHGELTLWDWKANTIEKIKAHNQEITTLNFVGDFLLTGSLDEVIKKWDLAQKTCIRTYVGHTKPISALWCDQLTLISGSQNGEIRVWNQATGECLNILHLHKKEIVSLGYSQGQIWAFSRKEGVKVWDFRRYKSDFFAQTTHYIRDIWNSYLLAKNN